MTNHAATGQVVAHDFYLHVGADQWMCSQCGLIRSTRLYALGACGVRDHSGKLVPFKQTQPQPQPQPQ